MDGLIAKMTAEGLERLGGPPGRSPEELRPIFKKFVEIHTRQIRSKHEQGAGGLAVCRARAAMLDVLVVQLLAALWPTTGKSLSETPFALVATGGYGRAELNPGSDIDLLFLEGGGIIKEDGSTPLSRLPPMFIQMLYDIGLEPGDRAVRTIDESVRLAAKDMETKTSLLEARLLAGDEKLFRGLKVALHEKCLRGRESAYIQARLEDQEARRLKHGNSPCMQEPNVKNGVGGLRDFQNLLWMAQVKYGIYDLAQLEQREILSAGEREQLERAYDFLLRVRTELHLVAARGTDTLTPNHQPAVAAGLGFLGDPRRRTEKFMHEYYNSVRNIHLITRTLEQRLALTDAGEKKGWRDLLRLRRSTVRAEEFDGFTLSRGQLHFVDKRLVRDQPARLMRAYLHAQTRGVPLHPDLSQYIRQQVQRLDEDFRANEHVRATFFQILSARGNITPALRGMHETGLLGFYLPEFGRLTNLVQHEYYHRYAVDEHTLMCIEKLDRILSAEDEQSRRYAELYRRIERPDIFHLALLLHDSGKASEAGPHEKVGGQLAVRVARRLELDDATTATLKRLIELHLLMVQTAQKRDLEDPVVIRSFSDQVETLGNLDMLTLHTFADSNGTSESLWNGFKDRLHWELHQRTRELLTGDTGLQLAEAERFLALRKEVRELLPPTFAVDELAAHFSGMPARYFRLHSAREIVRDLTLAHQFMHLQITEEERALEPVVHWQDQRDRGCVALHVCTWDRSGLFSKIAGALAAAGLNIFGAQIVTRDDGVIFDEFTVADARSGELPSKESKQKFERLLLQVLTGEMALAPAIAKTKLLRPLWAGVAGDRIATHIRLDNEASADRTLIEIETEDRVGLLFAISQALVALRLDLILAKIVTEKGAAIDSFYVTEIGGGKVVDGDRQEAIVKSLEESVASFEA